jgi:hypothetical protein
MKPNNLPADFQPFKTIRVGENYLADAPALVTIGGLAPLLVGMGEVPRVWLSVPGQQPWDDWVTLIVDNISSQSDVLVDARKHFIKVTRQDTVLFEAIQNAHGGLNIHALDLRPLSLKIFFDTQGLHVMGNTLSKSEFHGIPVIACDAL